MQWTLKDEAFKGAVVPIRRRLSTTEYTRVSTRTSHGLSDAARCEVASIFGHCGFLQAVLPRESSAATVTSQVETMGKQFIAGVDAENAKKSLSKLWKNGIGFSVDLLGEACVRDAEADVYLQRYLDMIEGLATIASTWEPNQRLDHDHIESVPRANVSVKISSLVGNALTPLILKVRFETCCSECGPF